jgi:hypothetical protein
MCLGSNGMMFGAEKLQCSRLADACQVLLMVMTLFIHCLLHSLTSCTFLMSYTTRFLCSAVWVVMYVHMPLPSKKEITPGMQYSYTLSFIYLTMTLLFPALVNRSLRRVATTTTSQQQLMESYGAPSSYADACRDAHAHRSCQQ